MIAKKLIGMVVLIGCLFANEKVWENYAAEFQNARRTHDFQKALKYAEIGLKYCQKQYGENNEITLIFFNFKGIAHQGLGNLLKAKEIYEKNLALRKKTFGANDPQVFQSMANLGSILRDLENYNESLEFLKHAKDGYQNLYQQQPTKNNLYKYTNSLHSLAETYRLKGDLQQSLSCCEAALENYHIVDELYLSLCNSRAVLLESLGKYEKAVQQYLDTEKLAVESYGENSMIVISIRSNLAVLYRLIFQYEKAQNLYNKILEPSKKILGENNPSFLKIVNNLASLYELQGKYSEALALFTKYLKICRNRWGENNSNTWMFISNLGLLQEKMKNFVEAEKNLTLVLQLYRKNLAANHPTLLIATNNLGTFYLNQRKQQKALPLLEESFKQHIDIFGWNHLETLNCANNLALLYVDLGWKKASPWNSDAEKILHTILQKFKDIRMNENHPQYMQTLNTLATLYISQQKNENATKIHKKLLKLREDTFGNNHHYTLTSLANLAYAYQRQKLYYLAFKTWKIRIQRLYSFLTNELWAVDQNTQHRYLEDQKYAKQIFLSLCLELSKNDTYKQEATQAAFEYSFLYKGLLLQIAAQKNKLFQLAKNDADAEKLLQQRQKYTNIFLSGSKVWGNNREKLQDIRYEIEALEQKMAQKLVRKTFQTKEDLASLSSYIHKQDAIVDFLFFRERDLQDLQIKRESLMAFIITLKPNGSLHIETQSYHADNLISSIQDFRNKIIKSQGILHDKNKNKKSIAQIKKTGHQIHKMLWNPIEKHLKNTNTLYLLPDGILYLLPFAALVGDNQKYFIENTPFITFSSFHDFVKKEASSEDEVIFFGHPNYNWMKPKENTKQNFLGLANFTPLPGTLKESQEIQKICNQLSIPSKMYSGDDASENNIHKITSPKVLHIATHGYFANIKNEVDLPSYLNTKEDDYIIRGTQKIISFDNTSSPNTNQNKWTQVTKENYFSQCGLAMAGANSALTGQTLNDGTNGLLTALEILSLNLHKTDLVVLSACDTGIGKIQTGEGIYSLHRAFQESGTKAVLATLWPTADEPTQNFMKLFYSKYLNHTPLNKSLRDTQLASIQNDLHPFLWAHFVMVGTDYKAITKGKKPDSNFGNLVLICIVVIFIGVIFVVLRILRRNSLVVRKNREERRLRRNNER